MRSEFLSTNRDLMPEHDERETDHSFQALIINFGKENKSRLVHSKVSSLVCGRPVRAWAVMKRKRKSRFSRDPPRLVFSQRAILLEAISKLGTVNPMSKDRRCG
jgi:hypothetical protein